MVRGMDHDTLWAAEKPPLQGLGLMRLRDEGWGEVDRDPAALVRTAVEAGVTLIDTAEMYGNEEVVGRAIAAHRDQLLLSSKFGVYWGSSGRFDDWSVRADPDTVRTAIEGSLRRLGVETIDLYYLHHRSDTTPIEETVTAMAALRQAGKIRALGLSNVTVDDIRRAHAVHPIQAVQQEWSLSQREVESMLPGAGRTRHHVDRALSVGTRRVAPGAGDRSCGDRARAGESVRRESRPARAGLGPQSRPGAGAARRAAARDHADPTPAGECRRRVVADRRC